MQRLTKTRLAKSLSHTFNQFDIDCRFQIFSGVLKKKKKKKEIQIPQDRRQAAILKYCINLTSGCLTISLFLKGKLGCWKKWKVMLI